MMPFARKRPKKSSRGCSRNKPNTKRSLRNSVPRFDLDSVRARLPGRRIDWFESLDSTMIEARRSLEPGRIVGAEAQTAGMGRHGRRWISEPGAGLYVSIVLAAQPVPVIMLALGLA